ncbi:HAD family hydrolase [Rubripirellula obstinata]|uniref:HAD family hydrolase n=1 Tax=Rubripirellula obstinata TaxID=406547 RepID=UPI003B82CF58
MWCCRNSLGLATAYENDENNASNFTNEAALTDYTQQYDAIIFDCDGTLTDSMPLISRFVRKVGRSEPQRVTAVSFIVVLP